MIYSNAAIVTTFAGLHFEVLIWRTAIPAYHRAFFRVRERPDGVQVFAESFDASADQLLELARLAKTAASLVAFLDDGGSVQNWHVEQHPNGTSRN